nr:coiled-coil domain-containing protein 112-like [Leptinotarsa decemlineata]
MLGSITLITFIMELHKLKNIQNILEKSVSTTLSHLKNAQYFQDIIEYSNEINKEAAGEKEIVQQKIKKMLELLKQKSELLKENRIADITDFNQFKKEMITIQENIKNLKAEARMKLELLQREYVEIGEDTDYYTGLLPTWSEATKKDAHVYGKIVPTEDFYKSSLLLNFSTLPLIQTPSHILFILVNSVKESISLKGPSCKEAKDFIDFVNKSEGHENGWRKEDHQLFLRFRKKFKNAEDAALELHETLPDLSVEEIKHHEEWYKRYLILQKKKKDAIKKWKKSKARNEHSSNRDGTVAEPTFVPKQQNTEEVRKKLSEWKLEKQLQQLQFEQETRQAQDQRRKELQAQKQKRAEELRKLVDEWKSTRAILEQKEIEHMQLAAEQEKKRRAAEANMMIKQFQSQDDLYISKMLRARKKEDASKPTRSKSSQTASRDPRRLLKPTKQWINRVHDDNIYAGESGILPLKNLPKLSVPEWRKTVQ